MLPYEIKGAAPHFCVYQMVERLLSRHPLGKHITVEFCQVDSLPYPLPTKGPVRGLAHRPSSSPMPLIQIAVGPAETPRDILGVLKTLCHEYRHMLQFHTRGKKGIPRALDKIEPDAIVFSLAEMTAAAQDNFPFLAGKRNKDWAYC